MISRYEFIDAMKALFPVVLMCVWAGVSKSGFYDWLSRPASATAARRRELEVIIRSIFEASDATYGYRRVHAQLRAGRVQCSPELVRAVMRDLGLYPCQPKPFRPTTTEPGDTGDTPDLVKRDFTASAPGTKLVGDITYIPTAEGFAYLRDGDRLLHEGMHRLRDRRSHARRLGVRCPGDGRPELPSRREMHISFGSRNAIYFWRFREGREGDRCAAFCRPYGQLLR